ncbi:MAG: response regulator transcription factor [Planctomycetota bacterium]
MATRVMVVDDHPVVAAGVRAMLAGTGFQVVADAGSTAEAVSLAADAAPDLLLIDMRLPDADGLECLSQMRSTGVRCPAIVFSGYDNPTFIARASALGASGFLLKTASRDQLLEALETASAGQSCWSREELRRLTGALAAARVEGDVEAPLTQRERQVLKQLAFGLTNKEIAQGLGISYETVKEHVQHILRKVGVNDRTQAAVWAVRRGLV